MGYFLERYILKQFFVYFFSALFLFIFIYLSVDFLLLFSKYSAPPEQFFYYYLSYLPEITYELLPFCAFFGVVFFLFSLIRSMEYKALLSLGYSSVCLIRSLILGGVFLGVFGLLLSEFVIPPTSSIKNRIYYWEITKRPERYQFSVGKNIWYKFQNKIFHLDSINHEKQEARKVSIYEVGQDWNLSKITRSHRVLLKNLSWTLMDGKEIEFSDSGVTKNTFKEKVLPVTKEFMIFISRPLSKDFLSTRKLFETISVGKNFGDNVTSYLVDFYERFFFPFTGLIFILFSCFFILNQRASFGEALGGGLTFFVVVCYWFVVKVFVLFGKYELLYPFVSVSLPFFLTTIWLFYRLNLISYFNHKD